MAEKLICQNKKAWHNYFIEDKYEAGISLLGSEVKSLREGKVNLGDSYGDIKRGEVFLVDAHISPYPQANRLNHDPLRTRKLLLHKREIQRLIGKVQERGFTLIPDLSPCQGREAGGRFLCPGGGRIRQRTSFALPP